MCNESEALALPVWAPCSPQTCHLDSLSGADQQRSLWWKAIINLRPHTQNFNFPLIACYNSLSAVKCSGAVCRLPTPLPDILSSYSYTIIARHKPTARNWAKLVWRNEDGLSFFPSGKVSLQGFFSCPPQNILLLSPVFLQFKQDCCTQNALHVPDIVSWVPMLLFLYVDVLIGISCHTYLQQNRRNLAQGVFWRYHRSNCLK